MIFGEAKEKLKSLISKIYKGVWCQKVRVWGFLREVISMIEATLKLLIRRLFTFAAAFKVKTTFLIPMALLINVRVFRDRGVFIWVCLFTFFTNLFQ